MKKIYSIFVVLLISVTGCLKAPDYDFPVLKVSTRSFDASAHLNDTIVYDIEINSDNPLDSLIIKPARAGAPGTDNTKIIFDKPTYNYTTKFKYVVKDQYPNINIILMTFEAFNKIGMTAEYLELRLARPLYEFSNIKLDTFNCFFDVKKGEIVNYYDAPVRYNELDFTYFRDNNTPIIGHIYLNPHLPSPTFYRGAVTGFMNLNISNNDFENIHDSREILQIIGETDAAKLTMDGLRSMNVEAGEIFGIIQSTGLKGVIRIDSISNTNKDEIFLSLKSFYSY